MGDQWHYNKGGKQTGPVSTADLKRMASGGQLSPSDQVWKDGMPNWARADTIEGLFEAASVIPQVILVKDPGQIFSERLASAIKRRAEVVQAAMAQGAADAEKAFPEIVKEIELFATRGEVCCLGSDIGINLRTLSADLGPFYLKGYQDRIVQLLNNSGFNVEPSIKAGAIALSIKW